MSEIIRLEDFRPTPQKSEATEIDRLAKLSASDATKPRRSFAIDDDDERYDSNGTWIG